MSIKRNMFVLFMIVMMVMVAGFMEDKAKSDDVTGTVKQEIADIDGVVDKEVISGEVGSDLNVGQGTETVIETSENTFVSDSEKSMVEESSAEVITEKPIDIPEGPKIPTEPANIETSTEEPLPTESEPAKSETVESETLEPTIYDPYQVVNKVIAKCEAGGMITTEDNLANLLTEGKITQAEYDEYYPLDGLEGSYYSVFVETDLNIASDIVGNKLGSVEKIADYIAGMLLLETQPIFNVTYAGIYTHNGVDFYEFRCYR